MTTQRTDLDAEHVPPPTHERGRKHFYRLFVLAVCLTSSFCGSTWMLSSFSSLLFVAQHDPATSTSAILPSSSVWNTADDDYSKTSIVLLNNKKNEEEEDANYSSSSAMMLSSCQEYTPECDSLERIQQQWNYRGNDYNQTICCREHAYLRQGVLQVWQALEAFNVTAWMDGGSAIGIARHNGTQVPWETDADISFWVHTKRKPPEQRLNHSSHQPIKLLRKPMANRWLGQILRFLNRLPTNQHPPPIRQLLPPAERQQQLIWKARIQSLSHNCVQFQLYQTLLLVPEEDDRRNDDNQTTRTTTTKNNLQEPTTIIDLFGVVRENTTQGDAYQYLKCFRNSKNKDQHAYDSFPPSSCLFYGTPIWCPRDLISYIVHYYGENVLHQGVSHEGFYGKHHQPGEGTGI